MKFTKYFLAAGVAAAMSMTSCVGDLDLLPTDPNSLTEGVFADDPAHYMDAIFADIFFNVSTYGPNGGNVLGSMDGGMSTFQRAIFNLSEIPTDEACWTPSADAIDPNFQYGVIPSNNTVIMGAYSRMMVIVTLCNQFIQTEFPLDAIEDENERAEAIKRHDEYVREARILRDGMYFYLIDNYGNVPWADESVTTGEVAPQLSDNFQEGRIAVFNNVVNDLEDIVAWYKANDPNNKPPYGYVGLDVAESLLVKFYLNAQVYTGTAQWKKCYDHAEAVIARLGKGGFITSDGTATGLCNAYHQCFAYNNKQFAIGGSSEINELIWDIPSESATLNALGVGIKAYANGGFMLNGWIGDSTKDDDYHCTQAEYNSGNGWKCMSAMRQFVEIFDWNATYTESPDLRTKWWKTAADGFSIDNPVLTQAYWGRNGFLPVKFTNYNILDNGEVDTDNVPDAVDPLGIDYAMIRLAEIYLSAAEAALQGGGDSNKALTYVNYIRERAGMPAYQVINLTELQNERCRELYTECNRRTDLIRYGKWISGYTWNWKFKVPEGTDYPSFFTVYAIPATVVERNGYVQNPGY